MDGKLLHTPEGVRDLYGKECYRKQVVQAQIHNVFCAYGFSDIQTPTFEYFDMFSREVGTTPSCELYKFFDREGNTLVLRPDFTPSVVRSAAKYYGDAALPVRLCYSGSTFINEAAAYQGRLKEMTQMGVELFKDDSVEADAEIIALVVDTLKAAGLTRFQVEIGNTEFFKGLLEDAGFDDEEGEKLRALISQKSFFGIDEMLAAKDIDAQKKAAFVQMTETFGTIGQIAEAANWTNNARALAAIERLTRLYALLKVYGCEEYVSFDLGMLSKYKYYTGIIFRAYTYGLGEPLVNGGRYDNLMRYFGSDAPAIGFAVSVDLLLSALDRQSAAEGEKNALPKRTLLIYEESAYAQAVNKAKQLRKAGASVSMAKAAKGRFEAAFIRDADVTEAIIVSEEGLQQIL